MEEIKSTNNKKKAYTIEDGLIIDNNYYEFERKKLYDLFSLKLPVSFCIMPESAIQVKYSSSAKPNLVLTDESGLINVAFSLMDDKSDNKDIEEIAAEVRTTIKRLNPTFEFNMADVDDSNNISKAYISYVSPAIDDPIYNLCFYCRIADKLLVLLFSSPNYAALDWKNAFIQMAKSLMTIETEDK